MVCLSLSSSLLLSPGRSSRAIVPYEFRKAYFQCAPSDQVGINHVCLYTTTVKVGKSWFVSGLLSPNETRDKSDKGKGQSDCSSPRVHQTKIWGTISLYYSKFYWVGIVSLVRANQQLCITGFRYFAPLSTSLNTFTLNAIFFVSIACMAHAIDRSQYRLDIWGVVTSIASLLVK